jgi:hypothetical protein
VPPLMELEFPCDCVSITQVKGGFHEQESTTVLRCV